MSYIMEYALKDFGVYGLVAEGKVVYIGSTVTSFKERLESHLDLEQQKNPYIRELIETDTEFYMMPLIAFKQQVKGLILSSEIFIMEERLIRTHKPIYNQIKDID